MTAFPVAWDDESNVIFRTAGYTHLDGGFNATHQAIMPVFPQAHRGGALALDVRPRAADAVLRHRARPVLLLPRPPDRTGDDRRRDRLPLPPVGARGPAVRAQAASCPTSACRCSCSRTRTPRRRCSAGCARGSRRGAATRGRRRATCSSTAGSSSATAGIGRRRPRHRTIAAEWSDHQSRARSRGRQREDHPDLDPPASHRGAARRRRPASAPAAGLAAATGTTETARRHGDDRTTTTGHDRRRPSRVDLDTNGDGVVVSSASPRPGRATTAATTRRWSTASPSCPRRTASRSRSSSTTSTRPQAETELRNLARQNVDVIAVGAGELSDPLPALTEEFADIFWYCNCGAGLADAPGRRPGAATTRRRSATRPGTPPGCCCRTPTRRRWPSSAAATSTSRRRRSSPSKPACRRSTTRSR